MITPQSVCYSTKLTHTHTVCLLRLFVRGVQGGESVCGKYRGWSVCVKHGGDLTDLCVCRDDLREHLKDVQKQIMAQRQEVSSSDTDTDSSSSE